MFDIGFLELMLVSVVGLLVLGPERLPGAIRTVSMYVSQIRRSFNNIRAEVERELKTDEIRQELHNQSIMKELRQAEKELREGLGVDGTRIGKDGYPIEDANPVDSPAPGDSTTATSAEPAPTAAQHGDETPAKASPTPAPETTSEAAKQ